MKKLLIALAAATVAASIQAASFSWKTSMSGKVYSPNNTSVLLSGTFDAYVFDAAVVAQSDLVSAYHGKTLDLAGSSISATKGSLNGGTIAATELSYGDVGSTYSLYFASVVTDGANEYLFISNAANGTGVEGKSTTVNLNGRATTIFTAADGYQGAGFYAVPEPTSGLLMLLGVAGLALRRRRV